MRSRNDRDHYDEAPHAGPYEGHRDDRQRDHSRQFGARDGEGGAFQQRRFAEPRVFDHDDGSRGNYPSTPGGDRARFVGPRYERDEGFDRDRENARFAEDPGRFDRATSNFGPPSYGRPESFVDAYQRDADRGRFGGMSRSGFGVPMERGHGPTSDGRGFSSRGFDEGRGRLRDRGFEDQAIYENREYSHHLAGVPSYEAARGVEGWNRWRGEDEASRPEASNHPSPYTPYVGPLAAREGGGRPPSPEAERGWSGQRLQHSGQLGGAFRNPAWEVPFERPQATWGERLHLGKGPRGYVRSDERIREEVCDCLSEGYVDASLVEVDVKGGVVVLTGQVPDKASKRQIEDISERCRGVQSVDNQLRVQRVTPRAEGSSRNAHDDDGRVQLGTGQIGSRASSSKSVS